MLVSVLHKLGLKALVDESWDILLCGQNNLFFSFVK